MKTRYIHLTDPEAIRARAIRARAIRARAIRDAEQHYQHLAHPVFCSGVSEYGRAYRRKIAAGILSTFYGTRLLDKTR